MNYDILFCRYWFCDAGGTGFSSQQMVVCAAIKSCLILWVVSVPTIHCCFGNCFYQRKGEIKQAYTPVFQLIWVLPYKLRVMQPSILAWEVSTCFSERSKTKCFLFPIATLLISFSSTLMEASLRSIWTSWSWPLDERPTEIDAILHSSRLCFKTQLSACRPFTLHCNASSGDEFGAHVLNFVPDFVPCVVWRLLRCPCHRVAHHFRLRLPTSCWKTGLWWKETTTLLRRWHRKSQNHVQIFEVRKCSCTWEQLQFLTRVRSESRVQ